jgi:hypothetical protein
LNSVDEDDDDDDYDVEVNEELIDMFHVVWMMEI